MILIISSKIYINFKFAHAIHPLINYIVFDELISLPPFRNIQKLFSGISTPLSVLSVCT